MPNAVVRVGLIEKVYLSNHLKDTKDKNIWEESISENSSKERACLEVLKNNEEAIWLQQSP